jgi:hypothetical protein
MLTRYQVLDQEEEVALEEFEKLETRLSQKHTDRSVYFVSGSAEN